MDKLLLNFVMQKGPVTPLRCWTHFAVWAGQCMKENSRMFPTCHLYMAQCVESLVVPLPHRQGKPQYSSREKVTLNFIYLSWSKIIIFFLTQSSAAIILNISIIVFGQNTLKIVWDLTAFNNRQLEPVIWKCGSHLLSSVSCVCMSAPVIKNNQA